MKNHKLFRLAAACAALIASSAALADSLVTNVVVRQRWPWSAKVDIDYLYTGTAVTSVVFRATWRGQDEPVDLVPLAETGTFLGVTQGQHTFTWDPVAAGYGEASLKDFAVSVEPGADPRTYLIVDLVNGGYSFRAEPPAGGWSDDQKRNKMVFRRIPAGTYTLGAELADMRAVWGSLAAYYEAMLASGTPRREVTLTSDFYLAVFPITGRQSSAILGTNDSNAMSPVYQHTDSRRIRGAQLADGETAVDWPTTGYKVASDSYVGRMRAISARKGQPALLVDLPTEAQWEVAVRAGGDTIFENGGTTNDTLAALQPILDKIAWVQATTGSSPWNYDVGLKAPTKWGIYDTHVRSELTLDWANDHGLYGTGAAPNLTGLAGGVDPIGAVSSAKGYRVTRGFGQQNASWGATSTSALGAAVRSTATIANGAAGASVFNGCVRLAIHLKPLQGLATE